MSQYIMSHLILIIILITSFTHIVAQRQPASISICSPSLKSGSLDYTLEEYVDIEWISINMPQPSPLILTLQDDTTNAPVYRICNGCPNTGLYRWILPLNNTIQPGRYWVNLTSVTSPRQYTRSASFQLAPPALVEPYKDYPQSKGAQKATRLDSPFSVYYNGMRWQALYLASEMDFLSQGLPTLIRTLAFRVSEQPTLALSYFDLRYTLVPSTTTSLSSSTLLSTTSLLASSRSVSVPSADSWLTFDLRDEGSSFIWPANQNLVLEIAYVNGQFVQIGGSYLVNFDGITRPRSTAIWGDDWFPPYPFQRSLGTQYSLKSPLVVPALQISIARRVDRQTGCGTVTVEPGANDYQWKQLSGTANSRVDCVNSNLPACRVGASLVNIAPAGQPAVFLLFGGSSIAFSGTQAFNDIWIYTQQTSWKLIQGSNCQDLARPDCRYQHSAAILNPSPTSTVMTIFGGRDSEYIMTPTLWILEITSTFLTQIMSGTIPTIQWKTRSALFRATYDHAVAVDNTGRFMYIMGGLGLDVDRKSLRTNQLIIYDAVSNTVSLGTPASGSSVNVVDCDTTIGARPPCTSGLTMIYYGNGPTTQRLYVYGGYETASGQASASSATNIKASNAYWYYDIVGKSWKSPTDPTLLPRAQHGATLRLPNTMVVYGGASDTGNLQDVWEVDLVTNSWVQSSAFACGSIGGAVADGPECAAGQRVVQVDETMVVFGGRSFQSGSQQYFNTFYAYRKKPYIFSPSSVITLPTDGRSSITIVALNIPSDPNRITLSLGGSPCTGVANAGTVPAPGDPTTMATRLTCMAPPGVGANVTLQAVVTSVTDWTSDPIPYLSYYAPVIQSVSGQVIDAPTKGGARITLTGTNFGPMGTLNKWVPSIGDGLSISFGMKSTCSSYQWLAANQIECMVPPGTGKNLTIQMVAAGQRSSPANEMLSYKAPVIIGFNYTIANTSGGTDLTMTGTDFGFVGSSDVRIWININDECTGVQWLDEKTLTCQLPPGSGRNNTVVLFAGGQSAQAPYQLEYSPPTLLSVTPDTVFVNQRPKLIIIGTNFGIVLSAISITVDGQSCSEISIIIPHTQLSCTIPSFSDPGLRRVHVIVNEQISSSNYVDIQLPIISASLKSGIFVMACLTLVLLIALMMFVYRTRQHKIIKASSPVFLIICLFGLMIQTSVVFTLDQRDDACQWSVWFIAVAFSLVFGSLLLKNYRLYKVFNNPTLVTVVLPNHRLFIYLAALLILDTVFLAPITATHTCNSPATSLSVTLTAFLITYKAIMLVLGMIIAFKSRVITLPEFNERTQLGYAIYNIAMSSVILLPLSFVFSTEIVSVFIFRSIGLIVSTLLTVAVLFVPKMYEMWFGAQHSINMTNMKHSANQRHTPSNTSNFKTGRNDFVIGSNHSATAPNHSATGQPDGISVGPTPTTTISPTGGFLSTSYPHPGYVSDAPSSLGSGTSGRSPYQHYAPNPPIDPEEVDMVMTMNPISMHHRGQSRPVPPPPRF